MGRKKKKGQQNSRRMTFSNKATWVWKADREIMDAIEAEAEKRGVSPSTMLEKIVMDWFHGDLPNPPQEEPKDDKPWFLR